MFGLMQDRPLMISDLIEFAARIMPGRKLFPGPWKAPSIVTPTMIVPRDPGRWPKPWKNGRGKTRPHRHPGLERLPPCGDLLCGFRYGGRLPHHQSAPLSRTDQLYRQPCRRQVHLRRSDLRAAAGEGGRTNPQRQGICHHDRCRPHARHPTAQCHLLRNIDGGCGR
jgi:hypothetical protein